MNRASGAHAMNSEMRPLLGTELDTASGGHRRLVVLAWVASKAADKIAEALADDNYTGATVGEQLAAGVKKQFGLNDAAPIA